MSIDLMMITNKPKIALEAEKAGVDRIFLDYELRGKLERQGHLDTHITDHEFKDISEINNKISKSELLVRVNPIYKNSREEIDKAVKYGADIIMLPMFKTVSEVEKFTNLVDGRVKTSLLLETAPAMVRVEDIIKIDGIDEIHIGLNDLHLSMKLDFMFELLSGGIVDYLAEIFMKNNIRWGFGGIAKIGEGILPAENILAEHIRLGSEMVILSRTFKGNNSNINELKKEINLVEEIAKIRNKEKEIKKWSQMKFVENRKVVKEKVKMILDKKN